MEARRAQLVWVYALLTHRLRQRLAQQQRTGRGRRARGRLNAIAALAREPEKAFPLRIPADHEIAVGREAAQAGPDVVRTANAQTGNGFDRMNAHRHVELFGHHVMRGHRIGVGGRAQQLTGVGLEIKALVHADHHRPCMRIDTLGRLERECRAALGLNVQGLGTTDLRHRIGPRARGVDHGARLDHIATRQRQRPHTGRRIALGTQQLRVAPQDRTLLAHTAQKALVQLRHIDVGGGTVLHRTDDLVQLQHRHQLLGTLGADHLGTQPVLQIRGQRGVQQVLLPFLTDIQHIARRQQLIGTEAFWRMHVEVSTGTRERTNLVRPIALHEHRRRATRGVITRLRFALQHDHRSPLVRQTVSHRSPRHARTNHGEVEHVVSHVNPISNFSDWKIIALENS